MNLCVIHFSLPKISGPKLEILQCQKGRQGLKSKQAQHYKERWNMAINNKLTCEIKIRKGILNVNDFKDMCNLFLVHVFEKGKG